MRIALVAPHLPDYCLEFAEVAGRRSHVKLFIADRHLDRDRRHRSQFSEVEGVDWPKQRQVVSGFPKIFRLARQIREFHPDLVHVLAESNLWLLALQWLLRPIPVMTTVHDAEFHPGDVASRQVPRSLINAIINRSDAILVHGDAQKQLVAKNLPRCSHKIFTFPHIPLLQYKTTADTLGYHKPETAKRVLFFGRIFDYKGLGYFLDAAPQIKAAVPNVQFVVAGAGDLSPYRSRIDALDCVDVRNRFIPFDEVARLFAEADALVLPYVEASQSGVLMTALPFGTPVIATAVGEMSATISQTGCGLLVPPRDTSALAAAVARVLQEPALNRQLAMAAQSAMTGRYSAAALSAELAQLYAAAKDGSHAPLTVQVTGTKCF